MAATQPTSVPSPALPPPTYTTPPNSQGYSPVHYVSAPLQAFQSPSVSANATPSTSSPVSVHNAPVVPQIPLAQRQIRPPKGPLYVPAALRPTDRPNRSSPLTPPRSVHGSTDSLDKPAKAATRPNSRRSTDLNNFKLHPGNRSAEPVEEEEEDWGDFPQTTGLPTQEHWKPDANASICDGPTCQKTFGWFERRHHCRHCGNVFCNEHSALNVPLDQNAEFHPKGALVRSCEMCRVRYDDWMTQLLDWRRRQRSGQLTSAEMESPVRLIGHAKDKTPEVQKSGVASSVTRDWIWSTF